MKKIGIFYGSTMGNTKAVAEQMAERLGADIFDVADVSGDIIDTYDNLIFGTSTWGVGDLQDDWEGFIVSVKKADLNNKVVAIFGFGDGSSFADTFVDGIGTIYEAVQDKGCKVIGQTKSDSYDYSDSLAEKDGEFVGLPLDDENQSELTECRVNTWLKQIEVDLI